MTRSKGMLAPAGDLTVWCERCGHSNHYLLGLLAEGAPGCQASLYSGPLATWVSWARGRSLHLTASGESALKRIVLDLGVAHGRD